MTLYTAAKSRTQMIFQIAVLALLLIGLINYKGVAGIRRIQQARATGVLQLAELPIGQTTGRWHEGKNSRRHELYFQPCHPLGVH